MATRRPDVTEAELAVMEALWAASPATIRMITDELYPDGGASAYATVQKLLERLEAKSYVRRERRTVPHQFRPKIDRAALISTRLRSIADALCGGSMGSLLTQLVENPDLKPDDLETLRDLVARLESGRENAS